MAVYHLTLAETERNVQSVRAVPYAVLPKGRARDMLLKLTESGLDVYAYASGGETVGTWCVWLGPMADHTADHNGRVTLTDWIQQYDTLYTFVNVLASINTPQTGGAA